MKRYHYEIIVDLETLNDSKLGSHMFDETSCITINFSTNNRLVKDELIDIQSNDCLINLQITKIVRKGGYLNEYNDLEEMDFIVSFAQTNRPKNTTDEVWFFCEANALKKF
ncbi:MAG: hypothetical protein HC836_24615 [Richelia sp. RM2_1_2]|nr:hypothetical protein [Richelia sp. SM1_7_0]NJN07669.1 hypothetical protein [Richelia sp. RM1_1_1]NJO29495.1 hypothetical protein [Richelia sp. SL_2_1]NJO61319.1 hypothetical protein [Richelia sp. RM2_1_2]